MTQALIHIGVTVFTREAGRTIALVRALFILTNAITANIRIQSALIHILGARTTRPAGRTTAGVLTIRQICADATIATRLRRASRTNLILGTNALIQLTHHWLLAIERRTRFGFLATITRKTAGTITMCAIHGAGAAIQTLAAIDAIDHGADGTVAGGATAGQWHSCRTICDGQFAVVTCGWAKNVD